MIAKVAVSAANFAIDKPYSYLVPQGASVERGMRVTVPFGRGNRLCEGVVLGTEPHQEEKLKSIESVLDETPLVDETMLRLAAFMRDRYFCTFYEAVRAMLPAGLWFQIKETYCLTEDRSWQEKPSRNPVAQKLLEAILEAGGGWDGSALRRLVTEEEFEKAIAYLLKKKWITGNKDFIRRTGDKTEQVATLASSGEEALEYASKRPKSAVQQKNVLELLCSIGSASVKEICYFTGAKPGTLKRLAELGYVTLSEKPVLRCREIVPAKIDPDMALNEEQSAAFAGLYSQLIAEKPGAALLHGVTGSGKTAVYIRLIQACLEREKQAVLLVPEIALTPQLLGLMAAWFGQNVAVLHSSLPATERYDQWKRVRSGEAKVVVGTRSAVFAPSKNLGLIILDEEQEHSYKSENNPRYNAKEVALWRSVKEKALLVLGSATPSVETMYHAKKGDYSLYTMKHRYGGRRLPAVEIVDMRRELEKGNDSSLSYTLQDAIGLTTEREQQSILFLNRRGNSRALVCVDCRESPECPRCSARLTYHSANNRLMCHYCGHSQQVTDRCPTCGGPMKQVGSGTQRVEQELLELFPGREVVRMDADTVNAVNTHEVILNRFRQENVPVLVGTQMVAKGLDMPNVTLVGVLDGDLSLYSDSYRAAETTFNMLTQVVGRAGRGGQEGKAIIQTFAPEHKVITLASRQDYNGFYETEIALRELQNLPPFGDLVHLTFTGQEEGRVLHGSAKFATSLQKCLQDMSLGGQAWSLLGPAPCPVPKINYHFRYRLTLRCKADKHVRELLAHLMRQFTKDKENRGVSLFADINGYE